MSASLDFALAAHHQGVPTMLVRWKVRDDPDLVDHWAVVLDPITVIDLMRVQVDGTRQLVAKLDAYPGHYVDRRKYPASLFLGDYAPIAERGLDKLPTAFMLLMARQRFGVRRRSQRPAIPGERGAVS